MAKMNRLLQIFPLLLSLFIFSSRIALANPAAINGQQGNGSNGSGDGNGGIGGNDESNEEIASSGNDELLSDLRVSAYLAVLTLCQVCSFVVENFERPSKSTDADALEILKAIRGSLVAVSERRYNGEEIPKNRHSDECTNVVLDYVATAMRAETTSNDPTQSEFLPRTSPNVRNVLLYQVANEILTNQDVYNCRPEFMNTGGDDKINILR